MERIFIILFGVIGLLLVCAASPLVALIIGAVAAGGYWVIVWINVRQA